MKTLSSFIPNFSFSGLRVRKRLISEPPVKKKIDIMLAAIHEVGDWLANSTLDLDDAKKRLEVLQNELSPLSEEKRDAIKSLREIQEKLQFIAATFKSLNVKQLELDNETEQLTSIEEELDARERILKDEQILDRELEDLKDKPAQLRSVIIPLEDEMKTLESDEKIHMGLKNSVNEELISVATATKIIENVIPQIAQKKNELENLAREIEATQQEYDETKEKQKQLNGELEEAEKETEKNRQEIEGLNNRKIELQSQLEISRQEKTNIEADIEEMESRKERMDSLNTALDAATAEKDELEPELKGLEETLELTGKESGELENELNEAREKKAAIRQEKTNLEDKSRPVMDVVESVEKMEASVKADRENSGKMMKDIEACKRKIQEMELETHYYKEALDEVKAAMG